MCSFELRVQEPVADTRASSTGVLWGLWLTLFPLFDFLLRPPRGSLGTYSVEEIRTPSLLVSIGLGGSLLLGSVPLLITLLKHGADLQRLRQYALAVAIIVFWFPIGILLSGSAGALVNLCMLYYALMLSAAFAAARFDEEALVRTTLATVAIGHAAVMLLMIADGNYSYGRLMGRVGPNYWGTVSITVVACSFMIERTSVRLLVWAIAGTTLVLVQSRGSMMGACIAIMVFSLARWRFVDWRRQLVNLSLAVILLLAAVTVGWNTVANSLLRLNDAGRGLSSGGTGRFDAFVETWQLFTSHPWFGVGYRQHEQFIQSASSAHNAYLAALAETGLIGTFGFVLLLFGAIWRALSRARTIGQVEYAAIAAFLCAFAGVALVERRGLNAGNSFSLLMLLVCAWSWRSGQSRSESIRNEQ